MDFQTAVKTVLKDKYCDFTGRASRSEYWWFQLFVIISIVVIALILTIVAKVITNDPDVAMLIIFIPLGLLYLAILLPIIGLVVRRFHDRDMSGWWYLLFVALGFVPIVSFVSSVAMIVIAALPGTPGPNRFGPDPLGLQSSPDIFK